MDYSDKRLYNPSIFGHSLELPRKKHSKIASYYAICWFYIQYSLSKSFLIKRYLQVNRSLVLNLAFDFGDIFFLFSWVPLSTYLSLDRRVLLALNIYIYIYIYITFCTSRMRQKINFKQSLTGLNFRVFLLVDWLLSQGQTAQSSLYGHNIIGFILDPRVLA